MKVTIMPKSQDDLPLGIVEDYAATAVFRVRDCEWPFRELLPSPYRAAARIVFYNSPKEAE